MDFRLSFWLGLVLVLKESILSPTKFRAMGSLLHRGCDSIPSPPPEFPPGPLPRPRRSGIPSAGTPFFPRSPSSSFRRQGSPPETPPAVSRSRTRTFFFLPAEDALPCFFLPSKRGSLITFPSGGGGGFWFPAFSGDLTGGSIPEGAFLKMKKSNPPLLL